ncbi:hypothetical protein GCM10009076_16690 [Erythrobacter ramosus]
MRIQHIEASAHHRRDPRGFERQAVFEAFGEEVVGLGHGQILVIPAKAGIQSQPSPLGPGLRRGDDELQALLGQSVRTANRKGDCPPAGRPPLGGKVA